MGMTAWYEENTTQNIYMHGSWLRRNEPQKSPVSLPCCSLSMESLTPSDLLCLTPRVAWSLSHQAISPAL